MAKCSFGKDSRKVEEPAPATTGVATATTAVATVPKVTTPALFVPDEEHIDYRDLEVPRINMVQKVGPLSEKFTPGGLVVNQELVLPLPIEIVFLGFRKTRFVERVPGGAMGNICNSPEEVIEAGGTLDFKEAEKHDKPWYQNEATAVILVKKPEGIDDSHFPFDFENDKWGLMTWSMKGSAFTAGVRPIKTARKFGYLRATLGKSYHSYVFKASTDLEAFRTGNKAFVPVFTKDVETKPEFSEFIAAIASGNIA